MRERRKEVKKGCIQVTKRDEVCHFWQMREPRRTKGGLKWAEEWYLTRHCYLRIRTWKDTGRKDNILRDQRIRRNHRRWRCDHLPSCPCRGHLWRWAECLHRTESCRRPGWWYSRSSLSLLRHPWLHRVREDWWSRWWVTLGAASLWQKSKGKEREREMIESTWRVAKETANVPVMEEMCFIYSTEE